MQELVLFIPAHTEHVQSAHVTNRAAQPQFDSLGLKIQQHLRGPSSQYRGKFVLQEDDSHPSLSLGMGSFPGAAAVQAGGVVNPALAFGSR